MAMICAILIIMSTTPLGYLNIGPLAITMNMIPVAVAAMVMGWKGGAIAGGIFGITSFLQCIGIGGVSLMGEILFDISPVLAFVQRFIPRVLAGLLCGLVFDAVRRTRLKSAAGFITGFCASLLNTVLFMVALVVLFGNTEYLQGLIGGQNIMLFMVTFVGVNALVEVVVVTAASGILSGALSKARILGREN